MKRTLLILILVSVGILAVSQNLWAKSPFFTADDISEEVVEAKYRPLEEDLPNN